MSEGPGTRLPCEGDRCRTWLVAAGFKASPPSYLDLRQEGVDGRQVGQAGRDVQEPLGQLPPQLQILQRPLETPPQLHARGIAQPGALPFQAARAEEGRSQAGETVSPGVRSAPTPGSPACLAPRAAPRAVPLLWHRLLGRLHRRSLARRITVPSKQGSPRTDL